MFVLNDYVSLYKAEGGPVRQNTAGLCYLNFEEVSQPSSFLFSLGFSLVFTIQGASLVLLNLGSLRVYDTGSIGVQ